MVCSGKFPLITYLKYYQEVIDLIALKVEDTNPIIRMEISNLSICKQNDFQFKGNYKQTDSLAIGNPLIPLLGRIFMNNLEEAMWLRE